LTLGPLVAALYFMACGGPYGIEEMVGKAGYGLALLVIVVTPLVWSLPVALMVGELSAALPEEGGYYRWVRRALGPMWGFQEAWLSLAASVFDMAIYPSLFVIYLGKIVPFFAQPPVPLVAGVAMIAVGAAWNLRGARAVGVVSIALAVAIGVPILVLCAAAFSYDGGGAPALRPHAGGALLPGILIAMWNYMGWDNASPVAGEVDRPQRTYPRALLLAIALTALTYALPVLACAAAGLDPSGWDTGAWVQVGERVGGSGLATAVAAGGIICGFGMFGSLLMAYSRLPFVLAEDGMAPAIFGRVTRGGGVPWVSILTCSVAYAACLGLGFERLVEVDVLLYGLALGLEFVALIVLRVREAALPRPFRVPGGLAGAFVCALLPMALLVVAFVRGRDETSDNAGLVTASIVIACGPLVHGIRARAAKRKPGRTGSGAGAEP